MLTDANELRYEIETAEILYFKMYATIISQFIVMNRTISRLIQC